MCAARKNTRTLNFKKSAAFVLGALLFSPTQAFSTPLLSADLASFSVLGASTVTNVPVSTVVGNVGVWATGGANAITGFNSSPGVAVSDPQVTGGLVHAGTALAQSAQGDLTTARTNLDSLGAGTLLAADLSGLTLMPGVYTVPAGVTNLSGSVTLDGGGNANAAWVFQMASTLITSPNSVVAVINTGSGAGLFWNVASSATIDVNTSFLGNVLALTSISANTTASNECGRYLADVGAVTLQQNVISSTCTGILSGSDGLGGGLDVVGPGVVEILPFAPVQVPVTGAFLFYATALAGLGFVRKASRAFL